MVTFLLSLLAIAGICLMLFSAVALVQNNMVAGAAPKEAQPLIQPKPERFKGQHMIGWILLVLSLLMIMAVLVIAIWNGVSKGFGFWQFFTRFLIILYAYKAFDMVCFDRLSVTRSHFFQHYYPELVALQYPVKNTACRGFPVGRLIMYFLFLPTVASHDIIEAVQ